MSEPVKRRTYRSAVRDEKARANREAILGAARDLFVANGYPGTSIASIATAAGVSEDLVYLHFKTKRTLLVEALNFSVTGMADSPRVLEQEGPQAVRAETDQRRQIAMFARDIVRRTERARPIDDVMRSAALVDPAVAEKHRAMHVTRLANLTQFVGWVAANGPLREGLSIDDAAATVWAVTGPSMHRMLVDELGWDLEHFAVWVRQTLEAALLPPAGD
jgi:AcrR family transcriptional regulator